MSPPNLHSLQAFRNRLLEVIDQAQHFGALGQAGGSGGASGNTAQAFREGLDTAERECESSVIALPLPLLAPTSSNSLFRLSFQHAQLTD
jgi:hypothetical protein